MILRAVNRVLGLGHPSPVVPMVQAFAVGMLAGAAAVAVLLL